MSTGDRSATGSSVRVQVRVPADAYNPDGFTEVKMGNTRWMPGKQRQSRRPGGVRVRKHDARQHVRSASLPEPGNPMAPLQPMHELCWTLVCDMEYTVRCRCGRPPSGGSPRVPHDKCCDKLFGQRGFCLVGYTFLDVDTECAAAFCSCLHVLDKVVYAHVCGRCGGRTLRLLRAVP